MDRVLLQADASQPPLAEELNDLANAFARGTDWERAVRLLDLQLEHRPADPGDRVARLQAAVCLRDGEAYEKACARIVEGDRGPQANEHLLVTAANAASGAWLVEAEVSKERLAKARELAAGAAEIARDFIGVRTLPPLIDHAAGDYGPVWTN